MHIVNDINNEVDYNICVLFSELVKLVYCPIHRPTSHAAADSDEGGPLGRAIPVPDDNTPE